MRNYTEYVIIEIYIYVLILLNGFASRGLNYFEMLVVRLLFIVKYSNL